MATIFISMSPPIFGHAHFLLWTHLWRYKLIFFLNLHSIWYIKIGVFDDEKHNAIIYFAQKCSGDKLWWPHPHFYPERTDKNANNMYLNLYTMWYIEIGVFEDEKRDAISNFAQKCWSNKLWWPRLLFTFSTYMNIWKKSTL